MVVADFKIVTERGGEPVTRGQLERFYQRYLWAGKFCDGRDVLEMACGTGPGLGHLASQSRSLVAGDLSADVLELARAHYGDRVRLEQFDAAATPFKDQSFDVVVLFEAVYYLDDLEAFCREVVRLLRPNGFLLLATANKDLPDFNPSPFSTRYLGPPELSALLDRHGFRCSFFGGSPVEDGGLRHRLLRRVKRMAVSLQLIPRSMRGKRLLKRLVFGKLTHMPVELMPAGVAYVPPAPIDGQVPDTRHQVIYCLAERY